MYIYLLNVLILPNGVLMSVSPAVKDILHQKRNYSLNWSILNFLCCRKKKTSSIDSRESVEYASLLPLQPEVNENNSKTPLEYINSFLDLMMMSTFIFGVVGHHFNKGQLPRNIVDSDWFSPSWNFLDACGSFVLFLSLCKEPTLSDGSSTYTDKRIQSFIAFVLGFLQLVVTTATDLLEWTEGAGGYGFAICMMACLLDECLKPTSEKSKVIVIEWGAATFGMAVVAFEGEGVYVESSKYLWYTPAIALGLAALLKGVRLGQTCCESLPFCFGKREVSQYLSNNQAGQMV